MYAPRYFASRYFAPRYFPGLVSSVKPSYFPHGFFAQTYFPDRYFPWAEAVAAIKPRYFYHGFFSRVYFPDRYFPGDVVHVIPPTPIQPSGGGRPVEVPIQLPLVRARLDLPIPRPLVDLRGRAEPGRVALSVGLPVPITTIEATGRVSSDLAATIDGELPLVTLFVVGVVSGPIRRRQVKSNQDDDEAVWMEQYLLSLRGSDR